jgi:hypothetical protein
MESVFHSIFTLITQVSETTASYKNYNSTVLSLTAVTKHRAANNIPASSKSVDIKTSSLDKKYSSISMAAREKYDRRYGN